MFIIQLWGGNADIKINNERGLDPIPLAIALIAQSSNATVLHL